MATSFNGLIQPSHTYVRSYFIESPWNALHARPTAIVIAGSAFLNIISTYFLQHYVLDTKDHIALFCFGSFFAFSSNFMVYYLLQSYSTSFQKISEDKKFYTISNLMKAGLLAAITPFAMYQLYRVTALDEWDTNTLRNLGCIYAIPEFVSLLIVRRMSWSTIAHHVFVIVFNAFSIQNDYANENVCRLIVVYAAFSTFAYSVNMLLASRFLGVSPKISKALSFVALCVYVLCCAMNWTWQVHYLSRLIVYHQHWSIYCYMVGICFVMYDDMVLNKWLLQNARNMGLSLAPPTSGSKNQRRK